MLLALHSVPQEYDEAAIQAVLQELTPANVRIMWSSKRFQVSCCALTDWGPASTFFLAFAVFAQLVQHMLSMETAASV